MCLFLPCENDFFAKFMADLLSIRSFKGFFTSTLISFHNELSKIAWHVTNAPIIYSASQEDNATTGCFLENQGIGASKNLKI